MINSRRKGTDRTCSTHGSDKNHILNFAPTICSEVTSMTQKHKGLLWSLRKFGRLFAVDVCGLVHVPVMCSWNMGSVSYKARNFFSTRETIGFSGLRVSCTKLLNSIQQKTVFLPVLSEHSAQMCFHATSVFLIFLHQRLQQSQIQTARSFIPTPSKRNINFPVTTPQGSQDVFPLHYLDKLVTECLLYHQNCCFGVYCSQIISAINR